MSSLKQLKWVNYSTGIDVEYMQSASEGRDVARYQDRLECVARLPDGAERDAAARELGALLVDAPMRPDYGYLEPSDLERIRACRPSGTVELAGLPEPAELRRRIAGAWYGRIAGCLLGKPVECYMREHIAQVCRNTGNYPLSRYMSWDEADVQGREHCWIERVGHCAPVDDDTNYTVLSLKIVEQFGRDFTPDDVGCAWLGNLPFLSVCTAERVAYQNLASGLTPPDSATHQNPYREYIGAQIRGDYYGYINPGRPGLAAEMAWRDASISHVKNGIYGEMFVAAMLAAAAVCGDAVSVIRAGLEQIPRTSRMYEAIERVLSDHARGIERVEAFEQLYRRWDESNPLHWCHAISNAEIVALALLYGNGDFGRSICHAVEAGFDTDCNGATVGSIVGMMKGIDAIQPQWLEPLHGRLATSIQGYDMVAIDDMVDITLEHMLP